MCRRGRSLTRRACNIVAVSWRSPFLLSPPPPAHLPQLSTEAKMRILSEIERELGLPRLDLSKRAFTLPGPTIDDQIGAGDGDGDGSVGGGGGDVAVTASMGGVEPFLRERLVAPVVAAGIAAKEEGSLKAELEAVKDRLRLAEEQLRCAQTVTLARTNRFFVKSSHLCTTMSTFSASPR